jgi:TonB family protein
MSEVTTVPVPLQKPEPQYTEEARKHRVESASVLMSINIGADGRVTDVRVLRPAGFGLDEEAVKTVSRWRFKPGTQNGSAVAVRANVDLNFKLLNQGSVPNETRTLNEVLGVLTKAKSRNEPGVDQAIEKLTKLAGNNVPAAQFVLADFHRQGTLLAPDPNKERELLRSAAKRDYAPALAKVGLMYIEGAGVERDEAKGLEMLSKAARLGSIMAKRTLGDRLEQTDPTRALAYYRGCGAKNNLHCQLRAGAMLVTSADAHDRKEATAWLYLARAAGSAEAQQILDQQTPKLTDQEQKSANELAKALVKAP